MISESFAYGLLVIGSLLLVSLVVSKISHALKFPSLIIFLAVGMIAGSHTLGGVSFTDVELTQQIGVLALAYILFAGGLDVEWSRFRPALPYGILLATVGVIVSTFAVATFAHYIFSFTWITALLLGTVVASTDAPAVFSLLRGESARFPTRLRATVEIESGMNDPMAVILTVALIGIEPGSSHSGIWDLIPFFLVQIAVGVVVGLVIGYAIPAVINALRLEHDGLYPVLSVSLVLLAFALADSLHGSGFLACYICGVVTGRRQFFHKGSLIRFHEGLSWLMQILMFLLLGLLVSMAGLVEVIGLGLLLAIFVVLIARPLGVFAALPFESFTHRERVGVAWSGLKGATPIVLATFPIIANVPQSRVIFNLVFLIVLVSALVQGKMFPYVMRWLKLEKHQRAWELEESISDESEMTELLVPFNSPMIGKSIMELGVPHTARILLVSGENGTSIPTGRTKLQAGDTIMLLADHEVLRYVVSRFQPISGKPTDQ